MKCSIGYWSYRPIVPTLVQLYFVIVYGMYIRLLARHRKA